MRFTLIFYYKGHVSLDFQLQIPKESATTLQQEMDENSNSSFCNQSQSLSADNSQVERAGAVQELALGLLVPTSPSLSLEILPVRAELLLTRLALILAITVQLALVCDEKPNGQSTTTKSPTTFELLPST